MVIRILLVISYIWYCFKIGAAPWRYFQLNKSYFSKEKGIFSKLELDKQIPFYWRLNQYMDDQEIVPNKFPVFAKPEWGQNAIGIKRIDNVSELDAFRESIKDSEVAYMLQAAASGTREFEIFTILSHQDDNDYASITITETINCDDNRYPINSIYNPDTNFRDITNQFSRVDLARIWSYVNRMGQFNIARVCVRTDGVEELLAGEFQVVEINLFLPMPINLLDPAYTWFSKFTFIRTNMLALARLTKVKTNFLIPADNAIFASKMAYQRRIKSPY